jgi:hypothetical protein
MKEALDFLIGKYVVLRGFRGSHILSAGNVDGTYYCNNIRFMANDVASILVLSNQFILNFDKVMFNVNHKT